MGKSIYIPVASYRPSKPKKTKRRCLGPGAEHEFMSEGEHNRRCDACDQKIKLLSKRDMAPQPFGGDAGDLE